MTRISVVRAWLLAGAAGGLPTLLSGCGAEAEECVEPQLELWCHHSEQAEGPTSSEPCEPPVPDGGEACGAYVVTTSGPNFTGYTHYFLDGEHVGTAYWTDVNSYCGGFTFWYGEPIECP